MGMHAGAIGVEDAGHFDADLVLAVIVEKQGFRTPLALVIAGPDANRVDVAPIVFPLGVDLGVPIHLAGGRLQDFRSDPFGQAQHVDGAMDACFSRLDGVVLVVDGRGGAGHVVDFVHLDIQGEGDIVPHQFEIGVVQEMRDIGL